jgi:hypothetical protein
MKQNVEHVNSGAMSVYVFFFFGGVGLNPH